MNILFTLCFFQLFIFTYQCWQAVPASFLKRFLGDPQLVQFLVSENCVVKGQARKRFAVTTLFKTQKWEIHSNFNFISFFEAICIYAHFSIAHCNVPPLGINLHQGWGGGGGGGGKECYRNRSRILPVNWGKAWVRSFNDLYVFTGVSFCGDFTLRYASENNFANLRSGEVFWREAVNCTVIQVTFLANSCFIRMHNLKSTHKWQILTR